MTSTSDFCEIYVGAEGLLFFFCDSLWNVISYSWKVLVGALEVVQMKMRGPAKSVVPQVQVQVGPGSLARNVRLGQSSSSHVSQNLPMSPHTRNTRSGDDQSGRLSPLSTPSLPSSSEECPQRTLREKDLKRDEQG